jgi:predicted Holliday junction resolvase-like endonuclease
MSNDLFVATRGTNMSQGNGKKRGRPRKQRDLEEAIEETAQSGHNKLTDDQLQALLFQHVKSYEKTLAAKKEADAKFKNACKTARAELGKDGVDQIKQVILLQQPEGEAALRAMIERQLRVARYVGSPIGTQFGLLDGIDESAEDRAYDAGKRIGLAGEPCKSPYMESTEEGQAWMEGFHEGQAVLAQGFKQPVDRPFGAPLDETRTEA